MLAKFYNNRMKIARVIIENMQRKSDRFKVTFTLSNIMSAIFFFPFEILYSSPDPYFGAVI